MRKFIELNLTFFIKSLYYYQNVCAKHKIGYRDGSTKAQTLLFSTQKISSYLIPIVNN